MAKKTNKTEHVLKLISKEEDGEEVSFEIEEKELGPPAIPSPKAEKVVPTEAKVEPTEAKVAPTEEKPLLINVSEVLVHDKLREIMERMNVCMCATCANDIAALSLNTLPPKYITTVAGKQFAQLSIYKKQYETDVISAITKACVRVKAGPRHK